MASAHKDQGPQEEILLGHNYDGIQEFDNPMPTWWSLGFWVTIVWAALYVLGVVLGIVPSYEADLEASQRELVKAREKHQAATPKVVVTDAQLALAIADPARVEAGRAVFAEKCSPCHGPQGQGTIGPNLTDQNWIHGGALVDITKSINEGFPDKGMPPWGPMISEDDLMGLVAFVRSIQGTSPPNPKAPQGDLHVEAPAPDQDPAAPVQEKVAP